MSLNCPRCKYPLTEIDKETMECDYCGTEYPVENLVEDDDELLDQKAFRCPNGCGITQFKMESHFWTCSKCSQPYFDSELQEPKRLLGVCTHCGLIAVLSPERSEYYCTNCRTFVSGEEGTHIIDTVPKWADTEVAGCQACGEPAPEGTKLLDMLECPKCTSFYMARENLNRACPDCTRSTDFKTNTMHISLNRKNKTDTFFCLDCGEFFDINFSTCPNCKDPDCRIDVTSIYGFMFRCGKCNHTFVEKSNTSTLTCAYDDDDEDLRNYWGGYYSVKVVDIDDSIQRQFLLCEEI